MKKKKAAAKAPPPKKPKVDTRKELDEALAKIEELEGQLSYYQRKGPKHG
jgi:hypothetical protein